MHLRIYSEYTLANLLFGEPHLIQYAQNTQANGLVIAIWSCREAFVAMIVGNVPMIKPIVSRYSTKWSASSSAQKSVGSDSSRSVEMGSRNQSHSQHDSERQSCDDSDSMKHIVGKGEGLEICTNKTYEVTYESSVPEKVVLEERVHALNMAYPAQARVAGGNGNNI